ncbi:MAG: hypothetical protein IKT62_02575, partial [Firmicutes bacterium]|nr:hypothetical protein [Bacillota bacterium]
DPVDSTADCLVAINALYVGLGDAELEYMKAVRAKFVSKLLAAYAENETYYPAELEKIKAITEEYLAKVNAITDIDDIDMYDATYVGTITASVADYVEGGKIADIDDASDVAALAADLQTAAKKYAEFVNEQISKEANRYYVDEDSTASADDMEAAKLNELVADLVGNSGARLSKEIEALAEQAIALVKTLPTYAAVEAAKEAADDAVDALPTTAKIADKALVDAAIAAVDAYEDLCGEEYTDTAVVTAVTQYAHAYNNEFTAKVKAVSTTDKAAVEALIDELDAFVDAYEDYEANAGALYTIVGDGNGGNYDKLEGYLADIKSAAAKKVVEAFAAIPVTSNITEAARPAVEAARAAYDAYVAEYTDTTDYTYDATANHTANTDGFVADDFVVSTLFAAEAALGLETGVNMVTFDDVDAKAYLQDLAVKARSVKTAKGNIKVTVVADVDVLIENGYTVEYKFYRSTKSNKGFGKAKKVTEDNTYTNTSGVKGTKYYYKAVIVAKNAEGEVVAKTPLKHCLYAARTWSK